jgi:preprotein translocase subunit SecA
MYAKLAGMTGTATTEAGEFQQVYKLEVLEIPTHKTCQRVDNNDEIYMSEREKYNAILKDVKQAHEKGQPILIGTESVEISEKLSRILKQHKLEHTVLNAKQNEKEAEIVAHAGKKGAITIATNMAGRGTDIKLEPGVAGIGGLYVMGTTRHQSRRIDRQLRGRCARQGDPGSSKFYVSFEDTLLRLFAAPRLTSILQRFRPPEGEPISAPILNKSIETAQKRIEQRNAAIRKHTLEYDDVMNKQRQEIYAFRNDVLHTDEIPNLAEDLLYEVCAQSADTYLQDHSREDGWDPEGYRQWLMRHFPVSFAREEFDDDHLDKEEIEKRAANRVIAALREKLAHENGKVAAVSRDGIEPIRRPTDEAIRNMIVRRIDQMWQEHLLKMDHLRSDVTLRTVGQRDPLMEFKHDAFNMFNEFSNKLKADIAHDLFRFEIVVRPMPTMQDLLPSLRLETNRSLANELEETQPEQEAENRGPPVAQESKGEPIVAEPRTGRNENCPCGSGKKYKKCCGANLEADVR